MVNVATTPNTIWLKSGDLSRTTEEGKVASGVTITPGMAVDFNANGVILPAAAGLAGVVVALENELYGKGISDNYTEGTQIFMRRAKPGDEFYMWLASGASASAGTRLETTTAGLLTTGSNVDVVEALEAVDLSGSPTLANARIKVRAL